MPAKFRASPPAGQLVRWSRTTLVGTAAVLALAGVHLDAQALALGAVTVQSALGEPLRAQVEVPQISSEEASSLDIRLASPDTFASAGMAFSPALAGAEITLRRRSGGSAYLNIVGSQPVNEPILGLVIEADWASGHIVRDYMMLLDPPAQETTRAVEAAAPTIPAADASQGTPPAVSSASRPRLPVAVQTTPVREPHTDVPTTATRPLRKPRTDSTGRLTVQRGNTASELAVAHDLTGVSLDQMLLAMLRANPDAFIQNNVNLIKAGAVISMPSAEQAREVSRTEAKRIVLAQTEDFLAYRRGLAQNTRATHGTPSERAVEGQVEAQVDDRQTAEVREDRLEISRDADIDLTDSSELAQLRHEREEMERVAELDRNISELAELVSATEDASIANTDETEYSAPDAVEADGTGPADATEQVADNSDEYTAAAADGDSAEAEPDAATDQTESDDTPATETEDTATAGGADAPDTAEDETETSTAAADLATEEDSKPAAQTATNAVSSQSTAPAAVPVSTPASVSQPEPALLDRLMEYRWLIVSVLALLVLLGIRRNRGRDSDHDDLEQIFADSGPGATSLDLIDSSLTGTVAQSSRFYETSEAAISEAAVHLEQGDDNEAEKILTWALAEDPQNISIHQKLAELYANRGDAPALGEIAAKARQLSNGRGTAWRFIATLGNRIDPGNLIYRTSSKPITFFDGADELDTFWSDTKTEMTGSGSEAAMEPDPSSVVDRGLDLDLADDFLSAGGTTPTHDTGTTHSTPTTLGESDKVQTPVNDSSQAADQQSADLDENVPQGDPEQGSDLKSPTQFMSSGTGSDLDLDIDFVPPTDVQDFAPPKKPGATADDHDHGSMIELNLDDPSLMNDLSGPATRPPDTSADDISNDDDPLATKLILAQEFQSIGDLDGAHSLATEVAQQASGKLKAAAEEFLQKLRKQ